MEKTKEFNDAIRTVADVFSTLQRVRLELVTLGTRPDILGTPEGNAIVWLGRLMDKGKEAMQPDFLAITS